MARSSRKEKATIFFNRLALITRKNMRRRDAQCNTGPVRNDLKWFISERGLGDLAKRVRGGLDLQRILCIKINASVYT